MSYTDTRSIAMGSLPKNERGAEPIPGSPISQEEDKVKNKTQKMTQSRTRCCLAHIINWSATNPAVVTR